MLSIRTVLCPVDFSASTARQVDLAVDLCRAFGARLILQHNKVELAIGVGVGWMWEPSHTGPALTPEQKLEELLAGVPAGTDAEMRLTRGPIVDTVVTVSRAVDADLVVLSTRGGDDRRRRFDHGSAARIGPAANLRGPRRAPRAPHAEVCRGVRVASGAARAHGLHPGIAARSGRGIRSVAPVCLRRPPAARAAEGRPTATADDARRRMTALVPADLPRPAAPPRRDGHSRSRDRPRRRRRRRGLRRHGRARPHTNASLVPFGYVEGGAASVSLSHLVRTRAARLRPQRPHRLRAPSRRLVEELQDTGFHYWPSSYLHAVVDSVEDAELALGEMIAAGIPRDQLHTWYGPAGSAAIDPTGRNHGRMARLWRTLEKATPERDLLERYASEVEGGHVCIGIQIAIAAGRARADRHPQAARRSLDFLFHGGIRPAPGLGPLL